MVKGSHHTPEAKRLLSEASRRHMARPGMKERLSALAKVRMALVDQRGSKNPSWKGEDVGYKAMHARVAAVRGKPKRCEVCGTDDPGKRYEWANLTGRYDDPEDYKRMCARCHKRHDHIVGNLPTADTVSRIPVQTSGKWDSPSWDELIEDAHQQITRAEKRISDLRARIANLQNMKRGCA